MARIRPDGTLEDDCPIGPTEKPSRRLMQDDPPFVVFERETSFAGRHATECGDDPVFDELWMFAAGEHAELKVAREKLKRLEAIVGEMDKAAHACPACDAKCVGCRRRLHEILGGQR